MAELNIAVIIVTYKTAELTINSLASLCQELDKPGLQLRAIVVDNASKDLEEIRSVAAARGWLSWLTLLDAERNGGFAYGNNVGIRHAFSTGQPDYIYLLNPDAEVRAGAIRALVDFMESHREVGIAGSSIENPDGSLWPIAFRFPTLISELTGGIQLGLLTKLLSRWEVPQTMDQVAQPIDWICGASMLIRRSLIVAIGGLDENYFLYFEETDFCLRARKAGFPTWYVPQSRIMHIAGQSTGVTARGAEAKRLPAYWFESRRRYFATNSGRAKFMLIDLIAILAASLGWLKRLLLGRRRTAIPHYIRDLIAHSIVWPRNRTIAPLRSFKP